jgi:hypothetical protein
MIFYRNIHIFSLLMRKEMKLPFNRARLLHVKTSIVECGMYEAFLEAAPQLLFQVAILPSRHTGI